MRATDSAEIRNLCAARHLMAAAMGKASDRDAKDVISELVRELDRDIAFVVAAAYDVFAREADILFGRIA